MFLFKKSVHFLVRSVFLNVVVLVGGVVMLLGGSVEMLVSEALRVLFRAVVVVVFVVLGR